MIRNPNPIAVARDAKNMSQVSLALAAKVSLGTIRLAEKGLATKRTLVKVARVLGLKFDEVSGRSKS